MEKAFCLTHPDTEITEIWVGEYDCEKCLEEACEQADAVASFDEDEIIYEC